MREKLLAIANSWRIFRNCMAYRIKCYCAYVLHCIVKRKPYFTITFNGCYLQSFPQRMLDWCSYVANCLYRFYLIHVTPNDDKTLQKYSLIHYGVSKPIHLKITNPPDEIELASFLRKKGFRVTDEHLYCVATEYEISKI